MLRCEGRMLAAAAVVPQAQTCDRCDGGVEGALLNVDEGGVMIKKGARCQSTGING